MAKAKQLFPVKIISPEKKYFEGEAVSVSAENANGPFDILARHTNFFSLLVPGTLIVNTGTEKLEITVVSGIVKVTRQQVTIFVNI